MAKRKPAGGVHVAMAFAVALALVGCSDDWDREPERRFEWTPALSDLTGRNLYAWQDEIPFDNPWDPYDNVDSGRMVITNVDTIFPFMEKFFVADGTKVETTERGYVHRSYSQQYNDPQWGAVDVYAALLYDDDPVWLDDAYLLTRSSLRPSLIPDASSRPSIVRLEQTHIVAANDRYRTAVYSVFHPVSHNDMLLAVYQQGPLLLEVSFGCSGTRRRACVDKLAQISDALGLNVDAWANAGPDDLEPTDNEDTFWDAQFVPLYDKPTYSQAVKVEARIKHTDFELRDVTDTRPDGVDYVIEKTTDAGVSRIEFSRRSTDQTEQAFEENAPGEALWHASNSQRKLFIEPPEKIDEQTMQGHASLYLKDGEILDLTFRYPAGDDAARRQMKAMIGALRVREPYTG